MSVYLIAYRIYYNLISSSPSYKIFAELILAPVPYSDNMPCHLSVRRIVNQKKFSAVSINQLTNQLEIDIDFSLF